MQACDVCRKRKVKCDRCYPCARCRRLRQPCTYTDILRKKGPKFIHSYPTLHSALSLPGSTSSLPELSDDGTLHPSVGMNASESTSEFGEGEEEEEEEEEEEGVDLDLNLGVGDQGRGQGEEREDDNDDEEEEEEDGVSWSGLQNIYMIFPVFDLWEVYRDFQLRLPRHRDSRSQFSGHSHGRGDSHNPTRSAFLSSLRAAIHAHSSVPGPPARANAHADTCEQSLHDALQARRQCGLPLSLHDDDNDRERILCSFFLFVTSWALNRAKYAWWHLRECIALALSNRMLLHREDEYPRREPREAELRRRLFWALFVAERTFCLLHNHPITLRPWIDLPVVPNAYDVPGVMPGFVRLVILFRGVGVDLSGCWTASGFVAPITFSLGGSPIDHGAIGAGHPIQNLEFALTQAWLRAKMWKLGVTNPAQPGAEFVASQDNAGWRLEEPLRIGRAVLDVLRSSTEVLGELWSGILDEKLYDICDCLCDIQPVMQTRVRPGEFELNQICRGLWEGLAKFRGRSAYLLAKCT